MALLRTWLYGKAWVSGIFDPAHNPSKPNWQIHTFVCNRLFVNPEDSSFKLVAVKDALKTIVEPICQEMRLEARSDHMLADDAELLARQIFERSFRLRNALVGGARFCRIVYAYWLSGLSYLCYFDLPDEMFLMPVDMQILNYVYFYANSPPRTECADNNEPDIIREDSPLGILHDHNGIGGRTDVHVVLAKLRQLKERTASRVLRVTASTVNTDTPHIATEDAIASRILQVMPRPDVAETILMATLCIGPLRIAVNEDVRALAGPLADFHGRKHSLRGVDLTTILDLVAGRNTDMMLCSLVAKKTVGMEIVFGAFNTTTGDYMAAKFETADALRHAWANDEVDNENEDTGDAKCTNKLDK
jgi:hypothetical protein